MYVQHAGEMSNPESGSVVVLELTPCDNVEDNLNKNETNYIGHFPAAQSNIEPGAKNDKTFSLKSTHERPISESFNAIL